MAIYAVKIPALMRLGSDTARENRPDPEIWRHVPQLTLAQAACLLADVTPKGEEAVPQGDAYGWYQALKLAVRSNELPREATIYDNDHTFRDGYHPFEGPESPATI